MTNDIDTDIFNPEPKQIFEEIVEWLINDGVLSDTMLGDLPDVARAWTEISGQDMADIKAPLFDAIWFLHEVDTNGADPAMLAEAMGY